MKHFIGKPYRHAKIPDLFGTHFKGYFLIATRKFAYFRQEPNNSYLVDIVIVDANIKYSPE